MKHFWVFAGDNYYPNGGMSDFIGSYSTEEEAVAVAKALKEQREYDWAEVENIFEHLGIKSNES